MKENFEAALAAVLRFEGGWSDHPLDPGGATHRGITLATLARARGRPCGKAELMALSVEETGAIYRAQYWDAIRGDMLPGGLDLALFDCAVHAGPDRAIRLLQKTLGVTADGRLGPATLAAIRSGDTRALIARLCADRRGFLQRLRQLRTFGRGWTRRIEGIERQALDLAPPVDPSKAGPTGPLLPPQTTRPASRPVTPKGPASMSDIKSILASRTVLSNIVGLAALAASAFGFDTSGIDPVGFSDAALQGVAALSFLSSTIFRVLASKKLKA